MENGGRIAHIYFCSSLINDDIRRKPKRGVFDDILHDLHDVKISKTLMIVDSDVDWDFATKIGIDFGCVDSLKKQGNKKYYILT